MLQPLFEVVRPIPAIALVPVAILLFPTNEQGIVFITFTAAFFPVLVSTRHAVRALPTVWEDAVRTMGGGRLRVLCTWSCPARARRVRRAVGRHGRRLDLRHLRRDDLRRVRVGYRTWQAYTIVDYPASSSGCSPSAPSAGSPPAASSCAGRRVTRWLPPSRGATS